MCITLSTPSAGGLTVQQFQQTWRGSGLTERSAAQQHFIDLCRLLGRPTPTDAGPTGGFSSSPH